MPTPQIEELAELVAERLAEKLLEARDDRPLFTTRALAERLGLSERTIRDMIGSGAIPSVKIGGARRVEPRAVDALLRRIEGQ